MAYAILVEEYQRMGVDLVSAMEKISELAESSTPQAPTRSVPRAVAASNDASMAALKGMLAAVPNAPKPGTK